MSDDTQDHRVDQTPSKPETIVKSVQPIHNTDNIDNKINTDITDQDIFNNLKSKLSKKYGEDVVNSIENNYNRGLKYDISAKENMEEEIRDKAFTLYRDSEIAKKQNQVYKFHELSREEGDKIIGEMVKYDSELQEDIKLDPEYFSSPANLNRVLKKHKQEKADKNMVNNFGSPQEKYNMEKREVELLEKGRNMNTDEIQEYNKILQYKLNKQ